MSDQKKYADGFRWFDRKDNQPDFVLGSISVTPAKLLEWVNANPELTSEYQGDKQVWFQVLKSKDGKVYAKLNTGKQGKKTDDLPF
jgi:hypothetical protein